MNVIFNKTIFLISIFAFSYSQLYADETTYKIGFSPGSKYHSIIRDRMRDVYHHAGLKVEFIGFPHKRSVYGANDGTIDGDAGRNPNVENKFKNLRRVNVKVNESLGSAYVIGNKITAYDLSTLKNYSVAYVNGVRWVEKKLEGIQTTKVKTYPQLIKMLINGRIDIAIGTEISMDAAIAELKTKNDISKLKPRANISPTYHFLHKSNVAIIPMLEKSLNDLHKQKYWDK